MTQEGRRSESTTPPPMIDSHQHLWLPSERRYGWIPSGSVLDDDFGAERALPELKQAGITGTVLVQAEDSYEDTFYMMSVAAQYSEVVGIVGWVPLDRPAEASAALDLYRHSPVLKGVRALTHDYADDRWILRPDVLRGIEELANRGLTLDLTSTTPQHLDNVVAIAERFPDLKIVVDHFAKPGIAAGEWEPWASQIAAAAKRPNVFTKFSGLNTVSPLGSWTASSWSRYLDHALTAFGASRIMIGSDWPVSLLDGDYQRVWQAQLEAISGLSTAEQSAITYSTAHAFYSLDSAEGQDWQ